MLVLSRHRNESVMIGDDVVITCQDIRGDKVLVHIAAPNTAFMYRSELPAFLKAVPAGGDHDAAQPKVGDDAQDPNPDAVIPPNTVVTRHRDQSFNIGDDITITIVDIRGDKVRFGIDAPQDIPVHRQEVYEAIKRENAKANQVNPKTDS